MQHRGIASAFGLAGLIYAVQVVLCTIVWHEASQRIAPDSGSTYRLAPFAGGFTTLQALWFAGIGASLLVLLLVALSFRVLLLLLALTSGGFGAYALWVTSARPGLAAHDSYLLGANLGFSEATILYVVAAGLAVLGVLLARSPRPGTTY